LPPAQRVRPAGPAGEHSINGLSQWASCAALAPGAVGSIHGASAVRRVAIRRSLGRAAAALGAGQARGGASVWRRRARQVSGMPGGRPPARSRQPRKVSTAVVRQAIRGGRSPNRNVYRFNRNYWSLAHVSAIRAHSSRPLGTSLTGRAMRRASDSKLGLPVIPWGPRRVGFAAE
jgi:hypothetical protein